MNIHMIIAGYNSEREYYDRLATTMKPTLSSYVRPEFYS